MTIFESLRKDHDIQRKIMNQVIQTEGKSDVRKKLFSQLKLELERHEKAEERFFYKPLIEHDLTQNMARHSIAEHKELDDFIEQLEKLELDSPQWLKTAKDLEHRLSHHLKEEEREIFQLAGKALTDEQKQELSKDYEKLMLESVTLK